MPRVNVKDKRKQQLIDANIASIAKRGLSETTIAHVSQGAGMSRGIVNFYFNTKESMMRETCQYLADEYAAVWERALEKTSGQTPFEQLQAVIAAHFHTSVCNQKKLAVWVAFWGHASSHSIYKKIIADADGSFIAKVSELWAAIDTTSMTPESFAYEIHALIRGSWLNFLLSAKVADRDALAEKCQHFLARALAENQPVAAPVAKKTKLVQPAQADNEASNVTELKPADADKKLAAKKKPKPTAEEDAALGDLFAMGS